ncbi:MAG TPA: epoxide hydrolase [Terriglobia bacterium]|nr:epoxide hydrolase [Terriglobia bacterium]
MPTRREFLLMASGAALSTVTAGQSPSTARPFRVQIAKTEIDRILRRVKDTRLPARFTAADSRYGVSWDYMKALTQYWATRYDWRKAETQLNRFPQFTARVGEFDIHFYHLRGRGRNPMPIILTHGWPGSAFEFLEVIGPLSNPENGDDGFDVVVPSLPGFGFSSKPKDKPVGSVTTAKLWHELMTTVLGYKRYGVQGGDWGSVVSTQLARQFPESISGLHLNSVQAAVAPAGQRTPEEESWNAAATAFRNTEVDYFNIQQRKPMTVSLALSDNPVGTAAWIVEKFKAWSDSGDDLDKTFTKDQVLTNTMIYLITGSEATGVWFYRGTLEDGAVATGPVTVPTGVAAFPREMIVLAPPRSAIERSFNLVHYTKMPRGGHFAALEQPGLFVEDLRLFFRTLR